MSLNLILGKVRADGPPGYVIPQASYEQLHNDYGPLIRTGVRKTFLPGILTAYFSSFSY